MSHNKLSRSTQRHRRPRLDMSTILSSNFSRRSVASSAPPSESINLGKLESTKLIQAMDDNDEDEQEEDGVGENPSLYYTAIASESSLSEDENDIMPNSPVHVKDILFSAKKKTGSHKKKSLLPTLLASDSDDSPHTPIRANINPKRGRRRSSFLGRHEVVLITSESDDGEEEEHQLTPRTPVRKVEDWLISTSPIPSSPATPARVILSSSSSSREASDNEVEEEHPGHDYIEDMEDSEATSKNYVDVLNPILGNLSLGDTTSKGGYSLMETIREEEEEEDVSEKSLEVEIIDIKAKRLSRGVQVELSSSEDEEGEKDEPGSKSRVSVSVQAELDDDSSDEEEIVPQVRRNVPILLSEDESEEEEESQKDMPKKALEEVSPSSASDDSDQAFRDFISSVKKKYDLQPVRDDEKALISRTPQKLNFSSDEDDKENSVPSHLLKKKTLQSPPVVIELSSDEEPSSPLSSQPSNRTSQDRIDPPCSIRNEDRSKKHASFLSSLSPDMADERKRHPDAIKYVNRFESHKKELTHLLYKMFNEEAFDGRLPPDMEIEWNPRLRKTAGICTQRRKYLGSKTLDRSSKIGLSTKVLDSGDRLRDTLIHEMCHAAAWVLSGYRDGHGPVWKSWAAKAMNRFPELPIIDRCHNYQIRTKYTYKCEKCGYSIGRHSKSVDTEKKCCGYCRGRFVLLRNYKNGERVSVSSQSSSKTAATPRTPNAFAAFVKDHYKNHKKPGVSHGDVMKTLSTMFKATKL